MVAKIESGKSIRGILHYNEDKVDVGKAQLLLASGFAADIEKMTFQQKVNRFSKLTQLNTRVKTNALHISLNFDHSDRMNGATLRKLAVDYLERIGFGDQPFLVYRHMDASHPHLHIATVNVKSDGQRIDIHGIGYRLSEPARKELEVKYHLVQAEGRISKQDKEIQRAEYGKRPTRQTISNIVTAVMKQYDFASFAEYKAILNSYNIEVSRGEPSSRMFENKGLLYSIMDKNGQPVGIPLKASRIYCKPTLSNLEESFARRKENRSEKLPLLKAELDRVLEGNKFIDQNEFAKQMKGLQVDVIYRKSDQGLLYGITYIDHKNKMVCNGSDLGKAYSAKAMEMRLQPPDKQLSVERIYKVNKTYLAKLSQPRQELGFLELAMARTQEETGVKIPRKRRKRKKGKIVEQEQQLNI